MKRRSARSAKAKPRRRLSGPIHGRILSLREKKGWTQQDLAEAVGVDNTAVSHWENGIARPGLSRLESLAEALDTTFSQLLEDLMARGEAA